MESRFFGLGGGVLDQKKIKKKKKKKTKKAHKKQKEKKKEAITGTQEAERQNTHILYGLGFRLLGIICNFRITPHFAFDIKSGGVVGLFRSSQRLTFVNSVADKDFYFVFCLHNGQIKTSTK